MLTVYKASAGSGKTFQLVVEYLKLLIENSNNYKHILAVTFTNKATNEMKSRILEQLHLLASNQESAYLEILQNNHYSEKEIRDKAKRILKNILHDYNRFSINTIDSFTQRIIKSFNRELGISPNFTVELDSDMILAEATDRLLAKIDKDKKLLKWLNEFSKEKIEENKSQRIDADIQDLGTELFKENFQLFFPDDHESVYQRENLENFGKELKKLKNQFEKELKNKGNEAVLLMEKYELSAADFSGGKARSIGVFFEKLSNGVLPNITKTVNETAENPEKWYTKANKRKNEIHAVVESELRPKLMEILSYWENNSPQYYTALAVLKRLRMLGVLADLKEEIKLLLHEKSVLQLSDSNLLLSKIIDHSDSPFIYEKTGSYFKFFMLDEFQDTSTLQWKNFKPLVENSLAEGNKNLIVGDVKQSIYRWRNSDWKILSEGINKDFAPAQLQQKSLEKNWRSDKNIIDFNNAIFGGLKASFEDRLFAEIDSEEKEYTKKFDTIYDSFIQEIGKPKETAEGLAKILFIPEEDFEQNATEKLVEQVKQIQDKGIKASEIAILIRTNKEGTPIINEFLRASDLPENRNYNLSVLSNESLFLYASKAVLFVMNCIELLIDPENKITKTAFLNLWEEWLKPELKTAGKLLIIKNNQAQIDFSSGEIDELDENFLQQFEKELESYLLKVKEKILLTSLDETITQICSLFSLFELKNELPFLQTLIDKAGELKTSLSNDLSNLVFWWNEKGYKTSVNVNEEVDSIRLLTVHKSKGLEYKAVLLPYLNWKTSWSGQNAPTLWCIPRHEPFNQFPLLPVKADTQMGNSYFGAIYKDEKLNSFVDTFNLIYVAFTRAKSVLIAICPLPKRNSKTPGKSLQHLLDSSLDYLSSKEPFQNCWNEDKTSFEFGSIPQFSEEKKKSNSIIIEKYQFNDFSEKLKLRLSGDDFLVAGEKNSSVKNTGKIIHDILAEISTETDIKKAVLNAVNNSLISETEGKEISEKLFDSIEKLNIKNWFNGSFKILNERSLLTGDRILRPDRIMTSDHEAIVVDYKTGEKKSESYNRQVLRYAKTLKETGQKKVSGYLWYINQNEVEKICEL